MSNVEFYNHSNHFYALSPVRDAVSTHRPLRETMLRRGLVIHHSSFEIDNIQNAEFKNVEF